MCQFLSSFCPSPLNYSPFSSSFTGMAISRRILSIYYRI